MFWIISIAAIIIDPAHCYFRFKAKIPNGDSIPHPCKTNYVWGGVGHTSPQGGGERNSFGKDFDNSGHQWTDTLCRSDSDGDGKTNGEELGDPNCVWRPGQVPERVTGITHPGVCTPFGEGICAGRDAFVDCSIESFGESCDVIKNPEIRSHDMVFQEHTIPNTETNYYCQYFDLPSDQDYHIVAGEGLLDNRNVLHHIVMYACPDTYRSKPTDNFPNACSMGGEEAKSCDKVVSLWTVGLPGVCLGKDIGFRMGATGVKKLKIEIHYNNPGLVSDYRDKSGMRIYYQPATHRVQDLRNFLIGQLNLVIPPGKPSVSQEASCPSDCTDDFIKKPVKVVSVYNHMHYLGRSQKTEVIRGGQVVKVLAHDTHYSYDSPVLHRLETPFEVLPGDEIKTTCEYSSISRKRYVFFGQGTNDEMCFAILTLYPADAVSSDCISLGSLSECDRIKKTPRRGCDWARFTNLSHPEMVKHYANVDNNCNLDGICRPECKTVADELKKHPCLGKEMYPVVSKWLNSYHEGTKFLAKLRSCDAYSSSSTGSDHNGFNCQRDCVGMCHVDSDGPHNGSATMTTPGRLTIIVVAIAAAIVCIVM